jgi:hypothetical protein
VRVIFERIDDSRYQIGIRRDGRFDVGADIPLRSAPGGGSVPHDIVHFAGRRLSAASRSPASRL